MSRKRPHASTASLDEPPPLKLPAAYQPLSFAAFCAARQRALKARRAGEPRSAWTADPVLAAGRFCNIDRRDDFVTSELLAEMCARPGWGLRERVLLCAALRFTASRRNEAAPLARLIDAGRSSGHVEAVGKKSKSPLCAALEAGEVRCGTGTYQLSLNRAQVASKLEQMATAVVARVAADGPFADVLAASDCVATLMTVGKRPQFSANETAKDFAYIEGLMAPASHQRCHLGPGARKGLTLVRAAPSSKALGGKDEEEAVVFLRAALRASPGLSWVETIDVEQALCEFSKYEAYRTGGVSKMKRFRPAAWGGAKKEC